MPALGLDTHLRPRQFHARLNHLSYGPMPTYEYRCKAGHDFERFVRNISEGVAALPCPECGEMAERKMSVNAGFMFKGSGFYLTDYGKNAHRGIAPEGGGGDGAGGDAQGKPAEGESKAQSTESKGEAKSEAKADAKSDVKPEQKTAAKAESRSEAKANPGSTTPAKSESTASKPDAKPKGNS